jgi:hypothetical protein
MIRRTPLIATLSLCSLAGIALAGGPAVVSMIPSPHAVVAGQATALEFSITACGQPMKTLSPSVRSTAGRLDLASKATPLAAAGRYTSSVTFPRAGDWTVVVNTGLATRKHAFHVRVLPAGSVARAESR